MKKQLKSLLTLLAQNHLLLILAVSWTGMLGSLYLSDIMGLNACDLCWYQRIMLYPVAFISLAAIIIKDTRAYKYYIAVLSALGALIAAYHYLYQIQYASGNTSGFIPCSLDNPCGETQVLLAGFITIPLMSLAAFVLIIALLLINRRFGKKS